MKAKILIVEDHVESAGAMARLFRRCGYEVKTARGYQEAIDIASTCAFDLLICEIGLPDGNGCALLRELHQQYQLDGIAVTTNESPFDIAQIQQSGFLDHFVKPVDFTTVKAAVEAVVRSNTVEKV